MLGRLIFKVIYFQIERYKYILYNSKYLMARQRVERVRVQFDKVERKLLQDIKAQTPEYADLSLSQVAKMELRFRLFENLRKIRQGKENSSRQAIESLQYLGQAPGWDPRLAAGWPGPGEWATTA